MQKVLPPGSVLIEIVGYNHYLGHGAREPRTGAVVILPKSPPKWVPLGPTAAIDDLVKRYKKSARGKTDEATTRQVLEDLHRNLWKPIEKQLDADTANIIVSPDGALNFVSFGTFLAEGRFLAEKYTFICVASGRDLLWDQKPMNDRSMWVVGNPDFDVAAATQVSGGDPDAPFGIFREMRGLDLPPLPGTQVECDALAAFGKQSGWDVTRASGREATKSRLRQMSSPRLLHLATHGFFLPDVTPAADGTLNTESGEANPFARLGLQNPMHRSGLALAGAQSTLRAWARGEIPPADNDGILTAEEAGTLNLAGTWLVTLSACDTGAGEAVTGEGVLGLRRGFIQAGAQHLMLTLWPVADRETARFMMDFYQTALKTSNAPLSLASVQRSWLTRLRQESSIGTALSLAGPFIISSQGNPFALVTCTLPTSRQACSKWGEAHSVRRSASIAR